MLAETNPMEQCPPSEANSRPDDQKICSSHGIYMLINIHHKLSPQSPTMSQMN
jgi:hypothetical protein